MNTVILLRTHRFGEREAGFVASLRARSGCDVYVFADETNGPIDTGTVPKLPVTPAAVRALGLPCPGDFGWRCGDYGFYLARAALPAVGRFWMVEPDVRFSLEDGDDLFALLDAMEADFVAPHVIPSARAHFWYPTMRWMTPAVYRCDFAFCRMSARAADLCLAERRRMAALPPSWIMWPNDETFVTTTLTRLGCAVRDINTGGRVVCSDASFGFFRPHRGETFETQPPDGLAYHPVLWGADYDRKVKRVARGASFSERVRLKILRGLARARQGGGAMAAALGAR